jgi:hypothetical protein
MLRPRPDRAVRQAVTDLARLHPDDLALILDALESSERERIDALIAEFGSAGPRPQEAVEPAWAYEGVSPWLRVRIDPGAKAGRANREFVLMTDDARAALVTAAAPFRTQRPPAGPGRSLFTHIWEKLTGTAA